MVIVIVAGRLAGLARRTGHPALGSFTQWASLPVSAASPWVARQHRSNARPPVEPLT